MSAAPRFTGPNPASRKRLPGLTKREGLLQHPWDDENGVRTSGLVVGRHLKTGHPHDRHATAYYGIAPSVFEAVVKRWQRTNPAAPMQHTSFIDIGSGMGRGVLLASLLPFRQVMGVELHPALMRIAQANRRVWKKQGRALCPIRLVQGDAVQFPFPQGPCLALLFNPFGAFVLRRWLRMISSEFANRPGELDVLYVNCEQEHVFEMQRGFSRLFLGKVRRSLADSTADRLILNNQPDGEYASAPYEDCSIWRWLAR